MATNAASASSLLARAEAAWAGGDGEAAMAFFGRSADLADADGDTGTLVAAALGLTRGQQYNLTPGLLPVRLHAAYDATKEPAVRARLAAALARCWAYANEPLRARPFALEALGTADTLQDATLSADALDAALASHWGPDELARRREWAVRLDDVTAHLRDPDARLQAQLWGLTVAWEVLDLPRMHRCMRAIELLGDESPRARFFAASRRLALELLRGNDDAAPLLIRRAESAAAEAAIPDAEGVLHGMRGYTAYFAGDREGCEREAPVFEAYAAEHGVVAVRAEAATMWLGAGRLDKVADMVGAFTRDVLVRLPRDGDWLLSLQCVLEGAVAVADLEVAEAVVELLAPYAGRSVVNAGAVMWHGVTDDPLARAYALLGDAQAADRHRAAALATYDRTGARWWRERLRNDEQTAVRSTLAGASAPRTAHLHVQPGGVWLVGQAGSVSALPRMRGLEHLHALLAHPGVDLSALELAGGGEVVQQPGLDVLDETARRAYRSRVSELDRELELTDRADLREERDAILAQLTAAAGLAGRARRTGSNEERARVAVRKAIIAALARIAELDPWLGRHLHDRVRTGARCRYTPDPDGGVTWILR
jgi:hypothetical protein